MAKSNTIKIDASWSMLFRIVVVGLLVAFLIYIHQVVMIVFVSMVLAAAINPMVDWLAKWKVPRFLGLAFIYSLAIGVIFFAILLLIKPINTEISNLAQDFPHYWQQITSYWQVADNYVSSHNLDGNLSSALASIQAKMGAIATNAFAGLAALFGGIVTMAAVLVLTLYMSLYDRELKSGLLVIISPQKRKYAEHLIRRIQDKIGLWLRGQLVLSLIMFLLALCVWSAFGLKYAWILALIAGVTEIIPYLGPALGGAPAVFIAFTMDPLLGVAALVALVAMHETENYLITPKVMQKAVGLNPVYIIVAMLIGAQIAGIIGIILAIPVTTALGIMVQDFAYHRQHGFLPSAKVEE